MNVSKVNKYFLLQNVQTGSAHAAYWGSFACSKMAWALGKSLCPHNSEVKNKWSNTFASPLCLHGMDRDNFTFLHAAANCVNAHRQGLNISTVA
jgi:hypothetical protein